MAGVTSMVGRRPAAPAPTPAGGIGVRQPTADVSGHPAPAVATDLPAFSAGPSPLPPPAPVPAPRVPAPVAARVGESTAGHPGNPVQAPSSNPGEVPPPATPGIGVQATHPSGSPNLTGDPFRVRLTEQMNNPGFTREGGIAVYRGNAGDGGDGPSIADRNALTAVTAQNQLAAYDMRAANIRKIDGEIHNQSPHTAVAAAIGGLATPQGRALAEGQHKMEPGSIPAPERAGESRYNALNVGPQDRVDSDVQGLHNALYSGLDLHQKVAIAAGIPRDRHAGLTPPTAIRRLDGPPAGDRREVGSEH